MNEPLTFQPFPIYFALLLRRHPLTLMNIAMSPQYRTTPNFHQHHTNLLND
jgi:hypothetical protein